MPVGVLRSERPQLRQIIACERAALEADRFHWPEVLRDPAPRVQLEMSHLQAQANGLGTRSNHHFFALKAAALPQPPPPRAAQHCGIQPHTRRPLLLHLRVGLITILGGEDQLNQRLGRGLRLRSLARSGQERLWVSESQGRWPGLTSSSPLGRNERFNCSRDPTQSIARLRKGLLIFQRPFKSALPFQLKIFVVRPQDQNCSVFCFH
jgi:hypothetical protein